MEHVASHRVVKIGGFALSRSAVTMALVNVLFSLCICALILYVNVQVEINLKRYPTPYPEDLKNMVKSVQNLVGKTSHGVRPENVAPTVNSEQTVKDKYEHQWPMAPKEISVEVT